MKIACIIHSLDGGGAERVLANLASRFCRRGHVVTLITLDDATQDRHVVDADVARLPLAVMGESRSAPVKVVNTWRRVRAVRRAISDVDPDVVLSFCDRTNILTLMAAAGRRAVVIGERSDPQQQTLGTFWEGLRRRTYRRAARIVALTDTSAKYLQPLSKRPVAVIESAVDRPPHFSDRDIASANKRIVGIGRLEHEKGFDRLIEAFATATKETSNWTLRILGEGTHRHRLDALATDLGIADRVTMPGWIRPVWDELAQATVFALPSRYEGFPSALLEAMAVGVPSVSVDCESGPRAIVSHEINGLLVSNSVAGLTDGITRMIADEGLRERIGQQGKLVAERFDWDRMVQQYEQVLQEAQETSS